MDLGSNRLNSCLDFALAHVDSSLDSWKNVIFMEEQQFALDASGLVYRCRNFHSFRRHAVSVLGCITVDGPREFLGWRFAQPHRPVCCSSAVKYWFESQLKIRCIPWPSAAEQFLPMKKVWLKVEEELNYRVFDGVNLVEDLWSHVSEVWPKVTNDTTVRNAIFEIPERCADYVNGHGIVE
ncbi:hypothetical protein DAPPUDRAFT_116578 [Daphnia pulex]|uniref:Tc1-like transposase DDE domain-containing protein n=1 Tax=Daphnia pulex TaxID=6669 RepID=E9HPT1_DAPPU|nr:hypothetical protein DAPPUDRAFT_116578 [Daphnia pulex]|eukprot:EFX66249.1 hypothetical protein DAPPUDRAFT_116578 [Daphnia pulex]